MILLAVKNLSVQIPQQDKTIHLLKDISFTLKRGETLAIIGESGCGKSTLCLSILGLLPQHFQTAGNLTFYKNGVEIQLQDQTDPHFNNIRGSIVSMVFQDTLGSFNPLFRCGQQIIDVLKEHVSGSPIQNKQRAIQLIQQVGLNDAEDVFNKYPHQLSGGMSQRVALALALASNPDLLIADEPASSLDSMAKNQYLDMLRELKDKTNLALILVLHDLNDALRFSDSMFVMYNGRGFEYRKKSDIQKTPAHPYTRALIDIQNSLNQTRLPQQIPGEVPSITKLIPGCPFHPRCSKRSDICRTTFPPPTFFLNNHFVCCHHYFKSN